MEGLEASEGSSAGSSDDDSDEVSGTSGLNCCDPDHGGDGVEVATSCPCSPQRSGLSTHSEAPEELQKTMTDPGQDIVENTQTERGETSSGEHNERKVVTEDGPAKKEAESPKPTQNDQETVTGRDRTAVAFSGEDGKSGPVANLEGSHSEDTVCWGFVLFSLFKKKGTCPKLGVGSRHL